MLERFLVVWLILLAALALIWPVWFPGSIDPFAASKPVLPWLIAVTMFSVGCLMRHDELRQVVRDWPSVLAGTIIQYTATPLMAYGFGKLFQLDEAHMIGVIIVGCVPGAMASNVLTMVARGNVSYSVSLTTVSTMVSPVVVPITMYLCLRTTLTIDVLDTARELVLMVVGPVVLGKLACWLFPDLEKVMNRVAPVLAPITILWIIAAVVGLNRTSLSQGVFSVVGALAGINLLGYTIGYYSGALLRFPEGVRRALTIEIGMQNAGLGVALAARLFPDHKAAMVPPALFTLGSMITATLLAQWWGARSRKDADDDATA